MPTATYLLVYLNARISSNTNLFQRPADKKDEIHISRDAMSPRKSFDILALYKSDYYYYYYYYYVSWNLVNRQEDRRTDGRTDSGPQHIPRWHSVVWLKTLAAKLHIERWSRQDRVRQSSEVVCPLTVKWPDSNQHWVIADYESQGYDNTRVRQSTTINCRRSVWLQTLSVIIMTSLIHGDTHRRLTPTDTSEVICRSPAYQTSPPIVAGR